MKKIFLLLLLSIITVHSYSQEDLREKAAKILRANRIKEFDENAAKNAQTYASYKPTAGFVIPDDFKVRYKYVKAWIDGDIMYVSTDAKLKLTVAQVLAPGQYTKILAEINKDYKNAPVFSEKILLSDLRSKMDGGTTGYYHINLGTTDNIVVSISFFDKNYLVKSPNPPPVVKGPKLNSITFNFRTLDHDKEAGKWVYFQVTKKQRSVPDYYKHIVGGQRVEDPAKWDYGDIREFAINTKSKNVYMSDFAAGGNITVTNMPTDLWDVVVFVHLEFADGTRKSFRRHKTSNPSYGSVLSIDFDKDFKIIKEYND